MAQEKQKLLFFSVYFNIQLSNLPINHKIAQKCEFSPESVRYRRKVKGGGGKVMITTEKVCVCMFVLEKQLQMYQQELNCRHQQNKIRRNKKFPCESHSDFLHLSYSPTCETHTQNFFLLYILRKKNLYRIEPNECEVVDGGAHEKKE